MIIKNIKLLFRNLVEIIFPRFCFGCGEVNNDICPKCLEKIEIQTITKNIDDLKILSFYPYQSFLIQKLIREAKFKHNKKILTFLTQYVADDILEENLEGILVPIPLHYIRKQMRGFNQSEYIAEEIMSIESNLKISNILIRIKNTDHQSHKNKQDRKESIKGAFHVDEKNTRKVSDNGGNRIDFHTPLFLVDDVISTGSTLLEARDTLKKYGFKNIQAITLSF